MALLVDASALYAQADADEPGHAEVVGILRSEHSSLVTTELAVAEADYLILTHLGIEVELAFVDDLVRGIYEVQCLNREELRLAGEVIERYRDLQLGLSDAALVVLAGRYRTKRILTLDERAFRQVTPLDGGYFEVLPADA